MTRYNNCLENKVHALSGLYRYMCVYACTMLSTESLATMRSSQLGQWYSGERRSMRCCSRLRLLPTQIFLCFLLLQVDESSSTTLSGPKGAHPPWVCPHPAPPLSPPPSQPAVTSGPDPWLSHREPCSCWL